MNVYTRETLARLLGVNPRDFRPAIKSTRRATRQSPTMYELHVGVDVGERHLVKIVAEIAGGFMLFPTMTSARIAWREQEWWQPVRVAS